MLMAAAPRVYGNQFKDTQAFSEDEFVGSAGGDASPVGGLAAWKGIPPAAMAGANTAAANSEGGEDGNGDGNREGDSDSRPGVLRVKPHGMLAQSAGAAQENSQATGGGGAAQEHLTGETPTGPPADGAFAAVKKSENETAGPRTPQANFLTPGAGASGAEAQGAAAQGADAQDGASQSGSVVRSAIEDDANFGDEETAPPKEQRGHDWWYRNRHPAAVPIRRTIQVVVREDRLAILPAGTDVTAKDNGGKEVRLREATSASLDEFANALRDHVEVWGSAGDGLYWRPVLELNVGPDGTQRADDLRRLLKNSGVEVRQTATAIRSHGEAPHETR
jgi:hypothetical protein